MRIFLVIDLYYEIFCYSLCWHTEQVIEKILYIMYVRVIDGALCYIIEKTVLYYSLIQISAKYNNLNICIILYWKKVGFA